MRPNVAPFKRGQFWRSRWAAIGAAVAVTFGGGGAFWAHAENGPSPEPAIEEVVAMRRASLGTEFTEPAKMVTRIDRGAVALNALDAETAQLAGGGTFFPINPYRAYDSRGYIDGYLLWGDGVFFDVITDVNGTPRIPATAVAVTYNLTVTTTSGSYGYLTVFPAGNPDPGSSSINWFAPGLDLANGGVVALGNRTAPGQIVVLAGFVPETGTDFIIDITGYYE